MSLHWHRRSCRNVQSQYDSLCQSHGLFSRILCSMETSTECEFIVLTLYLYTLAAAVSLIGTVVCLLGLVQAQRWLIEKWSSRQSTSVTAWWDSVVEGGETEGLLGSSR